MQKEKQEWTTIQQCVGVNENYKGCGKMLLLSTRDIFISTFPQDKQAEEKAFLYTFRCPCCGVFTHISQWKLPKMVRGEAMQKYLSRTSTTGNNEAV